MKYARGMAVLVLVVAFGAEATAHHSNPLYFDLTRMLTLDGQIVRVLWINPHVLVYLQTTNDAGVSETWVLQGASLNSATRQTGLRERLMPGARITARVWPPRNPLYVNDADTVLLARPEDARQSSRIVGAGQIRFDNGEVMDLGGGPRF